MTPPRNIIGALSAAPILNRPWLRRGLFAALLALLAVLTLFPERYRAAVSLTPSDPSSLGLANALGQLGALNTVFGNQAAVEVAVRIGESVYTRRTVMQRLKLLERLDLPNEAAGSRWLGRHVDVRVVRGGIILIETKQRDPELARQLVGALAESMRSQLAEIARRQTAYKRDVLLELVARADQRLQRAQTAYDTFRLRTRYSNPAFAIEAIGGRIPVIQAAIRAKEVELNAARQFATDENLSIKQIKAEIASLQAQLRQLQAATPSEPESLGSVVNESTQTQKLERELALATNLYYGYRNYLAGTFVEDLTSTANVRILEPPFIDTDRQFNLVPLCLAVLVLLLALAIEFYRMRPPVGERHPEYAA